MDFIVFGIAAVIVVTGALGVVLFRNPVHNALSLVATLFGVAVHFVAQEAHFLAAVQVIVYAGAIVVLFLFVIMLLGVDRIEDLAEESLPGQRLVAILAGALLAIAMVALVTVSEVTGESAQVRAANPENQDITSLGELLFSRWVLAFEATAILLTVAVVAAVVLARRLPDSAAEGLTIDEPGEAVR
jgi:NADH-quinone oxidoreductase subunit J